MTHAGNHSMTFAEFERLLEVYGGDRTRWPADLRAGAGQLVARDAAAHRLLAEAVALERALERAPLPTLAQEAALAERITAAAWRSPRMVSAARTEAGWTATVKPAAGPNVQRDAGNVVRLPSLISRRPWIKRSGVGGAAGVLAASLLLGIFIGLSSLSQQLLPAIEQMTGISLNGSYTTAQIDPLDEDLL